MSDATIPDAGKEDPGGPQEPGFAEGGRDTGAADVRESGMKIGLTEWSRAWCSARPRSDGVTWCWASVAQPLRRDLRTAAVADFAEPPLQRARRHADHCGPDPVQPPGSRP